jgi:hypothetical protein
MSAATSSSKVPVPERLWFANTDMQSFHEFKRDANDNSPFAHWLAAGRLFVTPNVANPNKYNNSLVAMQPGDPVFAYEDKVGFVALGRVCDPKDLRTDQGGTALYPKPTEIVRSVAVDWDTSVRRTAEEVASQVKRVASWGLQNCDPEAQLGRYMMGMLQATHDLSAADPDAVEAAARKRIAASPAYTPKMKAQLGQARIGQGQFRKAVLAMEPACRVTGVNLPPYLVASHIKPWAVCVGDEHLDGANGLMLAPHVDHLFDTGRISFTDNGDLLLAPTLDPAVLKAWDIDEKLNVGPFSDDQACYLAYHRQFVLGQPRPRRQRNLVGDVSGQFLFTGDQS